MSRAGACLWLPPSLLTAIQRWRKRVKQKKRETRRERERERTPQEVPLLRRKLYREVTAEKVWRWKWKRCVAAQRSGSTCRAMQAVFFMHKREGGRKGGWERGGDTETEVPHTAYPQPESFVYLSVWCSVKPTCLSLHLTFLRFFKLKYMPVISCTGLAVGNVLLSLNTPHNGHVIKISVSWHHQAIKNKSKKTIICFS